MNNIIRSEVNKVLRDNGLPEVEFTPKSFMDIFLFFAKDKSFFKAPFLSQKEAIEYLEVVDPSLSDSISLAEREELKLWEINSLKLASLLWANKRKGLLDRLKSTIEEAILKGEEQYYNNTINRAIQI